MTYAVYNMMYNIFHILLCETVFLSRRTGNITSLLQHCAIALSYFHRETRPKRRQIKYVYIV